MKFLYAPWREKYVTGKNSLPCVFCRQHNACDDADHFLIKRFKHCFVMLNLFPYNTGHLLVVPYAHVALLTDMSIMVAHEMMDVTSVCTGLLTELLQPDGFNIGLNLGGSASGGSIPDHLHMHIVPRWKADTSFLTVLAETKPISVDLIKMYKQLVVQFKDVAL